MKFGADRVVHLALWAVACAPTTEAPDPGGTGGAENVLGTGGTPSDSSSGGGSSGGALASGGTSPASGGAASGGAATGGAIGSGGAGGLASGGAASGGTASGGSAASGGAGNLLSIAEQLDGLRVDDPCAGTPVVSTGATCDHAVLTGPGFQAEEQASLGGAPGTVYEVTLRVRGVTEPTNVVGGERPSTETFSYMGLDWRTEPLTIGGAVPTDDADYAQWRITVAEPSAEYFLNDYQRVGHYVFDLDYEVTIPMEGGTTVTLEAIDANERLILNYEAYAPEGIPGSINHGQFVQLEVLSVSEQ